MRFLLYDGLNEIMFLFSAILYSRKLSVNVCEKALFFRAVSHSPFCVVKMVSLEKLSDNLLLMDSGVCLMMDEMWLKALCSWCNLSFSFLNG